MNDDKKVRCPKCGAVNGPGAPRCHRCGVGLIRAGFAARPVEDPDENQPRKPMRKPAPPSDDEDVEPRATKKAKRRRDEEPAEQVTSIRDNPILNMFFPVGVPLLAMGANYLGIFSILGVLFGGALAAGMGIRWLGIVLPALGALLGLLAIFMGGLSFIIRPKKTTYGSVTGYLRAIVGIICGLVGLVGGPIVIFLLVKNM